MSRRFALILGLMGIVAIVAIVLWLPRGVSVAYPRGESRPADPPSVGSESQSQSRSSSRAKKPDRRPSPRWEVRVAEPSGRPIEGAVVVGGMGKFRSLGPKASKLGTTDKSGRLDLGEESIPQTMSVISAHHPEYVPAGVSRPPTAGDLLITLSRGLDLFVMCRAHSRPVEGVTVRLSGAALSNSDLFRLVPRALAGAVDYLPGTVGRQSLHTAVTDETGVAHLRGLPPGEYVPRVVASGYVPITLPRPVVIPPSTTVELEFAEPSVYGFRPTGTEEVLGYHCTWFSATPNAEPMCGVIEGHLRDAYPGSIIVVRLPPIESGVGASEPMTFTILRNSGKATFAVQGVPLSQFVGPIDEQFLVALTATPPYTPGSLRLTFANADSTPTVFADYQLWLVEPDGVSIGIPARPVPPKLVPGSYKIAPKGPSNAHHFDPMTFTVEPGRETKLDIRLKSVFQRATLSLDAGGVERNINGAVSIKGADGFGIFLTYVDKTVVWLPTDLPLTIRPIAYGFAGEPVVTVMHRSPDIVAIDIPVHLE